jgi:hypothetical protein
MALGAMDADGLGAIEGDGGRDADRVRRGPEGIGGRRGDGQEQDAEECRVERKDAEEEQELHTLSWGLPATTGTDDSEKLTRSPNQGVENHPGPQKDRPAFVRGRQVPDVIELEEVDDGNRSGPRAGSIGSGDRDPAGLPVAPFDGVRERIPGTRHEGRS